MARMRDGESHVRQRGIEETGPGIREVGGQQVEALGGQRGEHAAPVGEMVRRRRM